jgi:glyoxylate reductase
MKMIGICVDNIERVLTGRKPKTLVNKSLLKQ